MDGLAHGDVGDGQAVAGQDVGVGAGHDGVAGFQAVGGQDIALLAVLILDEGDVGGAVGVILEVEDGSLPLLVPLKVDNAVLLLVAAAVVADGVYDIVNAKQLVIDKAALAIIEEVYA